jgi:hypothetical protein
VIEIIEKQNQQRGDDVMRRLFFLKVVLAAAVVLFCSYGVQMAIAAEMATLKDLQGTKAVEAYIQGGKFNFKETQTDGSATDIMKSFADFGVGNISTVKYAKKTAPAWNGNSFSVTVEDTDSTGDIVTIAISGTVSGDLATLSEAAVKKTVKDSRGGSKSVEWTFKDIPGGKLGIENYTNKKKVGYWKFKIPVSELKNHLVNVKFSEKTSYGKVTTFVSVPTTEQIMTAYGSNPYIDSYKEVALSFTFIIDL